MRLSNVPGRTLLVTGGTSPLAQAFLRGHNSLGFEKIVATTRRPQNTVYSSGSVIQFDFLDLENEEEFLPFIRVYKPSAILHLGKIDFGDDCAESINKNVTSARNLSIVASENGCNHFVYASSAAVYETSPNKFSQGHNVIAPSSSYGEMKLQVEQTLNEVSKLTNMPTTTLRIFNVYGEGLNKSLVNKLCNSSPLDRVRLRGLTQFKRDYIEVNQVAEAFEKALSIHEPKTETFDIGTGDPLNNGELISELSKNQKLFYEVSAEYPSVSVAETDKASKLLNFSAKSLLK